MAGYPFRLIRSSRGVLNCEPCLDFDQGNLVIPGWSEGPDPESRDSGFALNARPGMTIASLRSPPVRYSTRWRRNPCGREEAPDRRLKLSRSAARRSA